jgi:thioredoxin-like negative regulator of GroEL
VTAGLLLLVLAPIVLPIKLYRWLTGTGKKLTYVNTTDVDPLTYQGERPVVVALWATWASVWSVATERIMLDLQAEFSGRCEFVYVEAVSKDVEQRYGVSVVPAVLVFQHGREAARFINLLEADELRTCVAKLASPEA